MQAFAEARCLVQHHHLPTLATPPPDTGDTPRATLTPPTQTASLAHQVLIVDTHSPAARYARSELVPAVWTPTTVRTKMDALERLFPLKMERFHKPPVPPHMAVAFEATRYRELAPALKDNQDAIMQLAFFSSSDAPTAKRVATNYREFVLASGKTGNEKLVIQLDTTNKVPLLNMAALGPSYFSLSPEEGIRDCEYFFPPKEETFEEEEEVVPVSSSQKVSLGVTNAESDTVTVNAAEVPKEAILTEVESTAASEEPRSVTAEVTPPALEPAPTAVTPSPSPAVAAQNTSPAIAEETPSATAEATPPAVEPVPIAAAPSPTPAVAEPTPLPVIAETTPPPAATKPTSPTAETVPAPPPSPSRVAEKNRPVTVSKVPSLSHDQVIPNDLGKHVPIKLVDSAEEGAATEEGTAAEEGAAAAPEEGGVPAAEVPAGVEQEAAPAPAPAADATPAAEPSSEAGDGPEAAAATPQEEDQKAEGEAPPA
ncbi:calphotin-like [Schistocerca serialis cubense]|uniref:calphotin-like n=1 Tax=Schistocerca serialis cubense TaxID=2023355 RepID=UPI00214E3077|nr:calphotin-like [Schistocerca serialis cubense]